MTSERFEALLIAEEHCLEQGHHDDRSINIVYTEQGYAPAVCDECLEYADKMIEAWKSQMMSIIVESIRKD